MPPSRLVQLRLPRLPRLPRLQLLQRAPVPRPRPAQYPAAPRLLAQRTKKRKKKQRERKKERERERERERETHSIQYDYLMQCSNVIYTLRYYYGVKFVSWLRPKT